MIALLLKFGHVDASEGRAMFLALSTKSRTHHVLKRGGCTAAAQHHPVQPTPQVYGLLSGAYITRRPTSLPISDETFVE